MAELNIKQIIDRLKIQSLRESHTSLYTTERLVRRILGMQELPGM